MDNLPKHHGAGPPEARGPMQLHRLHRLKAGPDRELWALSSLWLATLWFALTARYAIMRTGNQTALSKLVENWSAHRHLYQLRKLGSDYVIYSKLSRSLQNEQAHCVFNVFLNKGRKLVVWARGRNFSWMGPTGHRKGRKKSWEVIVFPDVDVYTKTRNHRKTLWKTQRKQQPTENQEC